MAITCRKEKRVTGLAGVAHGPYGYVISVDGVEVANVFAFRKGFEFDYYGWTFQVFKKEGLDCYQHWNDPEKVEKGKGRFFKFTDEGKETAKVACLDYIKTEFGRDK